MKFLYCQQAQWGQEDRHIKQDPADSGLKYRFVSTLLASSNWLVCFRMQDVDPLFDLGLSHKPRI